MPVSRGSEIKVGLFTLIALGAFLAAVLVLTSKSSLFRESITVRTSFKNIAGLIAGAEVRVSGVTIGSVSSIAFSSRPGDATVFVELTIDDRGMRKVTKDSKATIDTLGLLGKKYVEIVPGRGPLVRHHDFIQGSEPASLTDALEKGGKILDEIGQTAEYLKVLFASVSGQGAQETDLSRTITSIRNIVENVQNGSGALHELIYDPNKAQIVANILATTNDLRVTTGDVRQINANVRSGSGTLHELIYGAQYKRLIENLADTSEAIRQVVHDIRTERGVMYGLIYDHEQYKILDDLRVTAADLRRIMDRIDRGEGTIGGLVVDPTIYEDIKKLTGEVERNRVLKTYIRYVVRQREQELEQAERPPHNPPPAETSPTPTPHD